MSSRKDLDPKRFLEIQNEREKLIFICKLANLAPSSHNMQPWLFRIEQRSIVVIPNSKLRLSIADPQGREFFTTLGTLTGLIKLISKSYGLEYEWRPSDNFEKEIGRITFLNLDGKSPDYTTLKAVINRHNSRLPFTSDPLPEVFLTKIKNFFNTDSELVLIDDLKTKQRIEDIILNSVQEAFADKNFCEELYPWLKNSWFRFEDGLPGYNLGVPFLVSLFFPYLTRRGVTSKKQIEIHKKMLDNASVFGLICSDQENSKGWLSIGELFIQIAVEAEKNGISIGVMQASIENPSDKSRLSTLLDIQKRPQMFFRLGFCNLRHKHSPRRPIEKVIVST